ncbi:MAG: 5-oxoprolinase subunit PxpB [Candidatus Limnocylindrales bacterium]
MADASGSSLGPPRLRPFGEAAVMIELGGGIDLRSNATALAIADAVRGDAAGGWLTPLAAYDSVLVPFDPDRLEADLALERLAGIASDVVERGVVITSGIEHTIPVRYGGRDGPDLEAVGEVLDLTPAQVVDAHVAQAYRVFVLGFSPGFAYLGPLPDALQVPRHAQPRPRIPVGSVAIAGAQTAIYPGATAGGWQLIGRTAVRVWDAHRDPPSLLRPGDRVRFEPLRD